MREWRLPRLFPVYPLLRLQWLGRHGSREAEKWDVDPVLISD